jgi:hypothetical protein
MNEWRWQLDIAYGNTETEKVMQKKWLRIQAHHWSRLDRSTCWPPAVQQATHYHCYLRRMRKVMFWSLCIYLFISGSLPHLTQQVFNRIAWHLVGWLVIIRWIFNYILGAIGSLEDYNKLIINFLALSNWKLAADNDMGTATTCWHYVSHTRASWNVMMLLNVWDLSLIELWAAKACSLSSAVLFIQ